MTTAHGRARAAIIARCREGGDTRALRADVIGELRRVVPFEWYVWVVTDPRTAVGVDPLAEVPDLRRLPALIARKYRTALNHWTRLAAPASLGSAAPQSELWRDVQQPAGVVDVASCAFRDRFGVWGFLDLWSRVAVTPPTLDLLREVAEPLTAALRTGVGKQLRRRPVASPSDATAPAHAAVVLLDAFLEVRGMTPAARGVLGQLLPRDDGGPTIPAAAFNVAAQLLAIETGLELAEPSGRLHLADGHWVTVRASRIEASETIAVAIEPLAASDRLDLCARAFGFTTRERAVASDVAQGNSTAAIAADLFISANTVQDHLKSIFTKTGVHSRRDLVPLLVGAEP